MKDSIKYFINWFITSSADPLKTSLALRGFLIAILPKIVIALPIICSMVSVCIDPAHLNPVIDILADITKWTMYVVGGIVGLVGLYRKLKNGRWSSF